MAPSAIIRPQRSSIVRRYLKGEPGSWRKNATEDAFILESWGQGFIVGALLIMALITISNMKKGILLHKLIFVEVRGEQIKTLCWCANVFYQLILALSHGTFCFMSFKGYGWYLSATAELLYLSTLVHNVVAWLKIRPFLTRRGSVIFIGSFIMTIPPVLFQSINNFLFFNNISDLYTKVRPYEALMRLADVLSLSISMLTTSQRSMVDVFLLLVLLRYQNAVHSHVQKLDDGTTTLCHHDHVYDVLLHLLIH